MKTLLTDEKKNLKTSFSVNIVIKTSCDGDLTDGFFSDDPVIVKTVCDHKNTRNDPWRCAKRD